MAKKKHCSSHKNTSEEKINLMLFPVFIANFTAISLFFKSFAQEVENSILAKQKQKSLIELLSQQRVMQM